MFQTNQEDFIRQLSLHHVILVLGKFSQEGCGRYTFICRTGQ